MSRIPKYGSRRSRGYLSLELYVAQTTRPNARPREGSSSVMKRRKKRGTKTNMLWYWWCCSVLCSTLANRGWREASTWASSLTLSQAREKMTTRHDSPAHRCHRVLLCAATTRREESTRGEMLGICVSSAKTNMSNVPEQCT